MALPYLVKHIYSYGTEEVIRRGKKIFALKNIELAKFDPLIGSIHCRVKDDGYSTYYKVTIENFKSAATLSLRCGCPYNLSEVCRHKAAALFYIQDLFVIYYSYELKLIFVFARRSTNFLSFNSRS